jgi:multidrug resistance efflux pump
MQTTQHPRTEPLERRPSSPAGNHPLGKRRSRFRTSFFVLFGIALLGGSVVGTGLVLKAHPVDGTRSVDSGPVESKGVVGFGFVDVEQRIASLGALAQSARVVEILVHENQPVKKGAVLLRFDSRLAEAKVREAEGDFRVAQQREEAAQDLPKQHEEDINQQQEAVSAATAEVAAAQAQLKKTESQVNSKVVPGIRREDAEAAREKVRQAEAAERAAKAKLRQIKLRNPQHLINQARSAVASKKGQLELAKVALEECELKAPSDGTILRLGVSVGDVLGGMQPREEAIVFCPAGPRIIRAEIEQEEANLVKVGMPAMIKDDARLAGEWHGKVKSISDWFARRRSLLLEPRQFNDVRTLECIIELDPNQPPLKIGQRVRVTIGK